MSYTLDSTVHRHTHGTWMKERLQPFSPPPPLLGSTTVYHYSDVIVKFLALVFSLTVATIPTLMKWFSCLPSKWTLWECKHFTLMWLVVMHYMKVNGLFWLPLRTIIMKMPSNCLYYSTSGDRYTWLAFMYEYTNGVQSLLCKGNFHCSF